MSGAIPPLTQYAFMAWCLAKAKGQLYLYLYHAMKAYWGSGGIARHIFDLGSIWRRAVYGARQRHAFRFGDDS